MRRSPVVLALYLCAALGASAQEVVPITEADVRGMIAAMDRAVDARDAKAVLAFVADDADIRIIEDLPEGEIGYSLTKAEFAEYFAATVEAMPEIPKRKSLKIFVFPDGSGAVATDETTVTLDLGPLAIYARETQKATVRRRGEALRIVKLDVISDVQLDGFMPPQRRRSSPPSRR